MITNNIDLAEKVEVFRQSLGFEGLKDQELKEIADLASVKQLDRGETVFYQDENCQFFYVVAKGIVKVSISSPSGIRITYLLAKRGDPLNLVSPFTDSPSSLSAEVLEKATLLCIPKKNFVSFVFKYPEVLINIFAILEQTIDSANIRVIDMLEKRVEQRLCKVLYNLYTKFGTTLKFTCSELSELTCTTTESTLRAMSRLRESGVIKKIGRGEISIIKPSTLKPSTAETLWF